LLMASTICMFGCALPASSDTQDARNKLIEAHVAKYREEACGTHWVGNPSFTDCMAALRREALAKYPAADGPSTNSPAGFVGSSFRSQDTAW